MEDYVVTFKSGRVVYISIEEFKNISNSTKPFVVFCNRSDPYIFINMNEVESIKPK